MVKSPQFPLRAFLIMFFPTLHNCKEQKLTDVSSSLIIPTLQRKLFEEVFIKERSNNGFSVK